MSNGPKVARELDLVQGDFLGDRVLDMTHTTVREYIPFDLELPKDFLKFRKNVLDWFAVAGALKVVHMFCHGGNKLTLIMSHA